MRNEWTEWTEWTEWNEWNCPCLIPHSSFLIPSSSS